jgi:protein ImuA
MSQRGTSAGILFLRERIAAIEGRGATGPLARPGKRARINFGEGSSLDRLLDGGLSRGTLHEIIPGRPGDAPAAAGFAAALAARFVAKAGKTHPIVWILEDGTRREWGTPYGPGLRLHGLDPARFVLVHTRNVRESLWSLEEAVKCRAPAAVVAEIWTLEQAYGLAASRRLVLAARASGTPALLVAPKLARDADRWSSTAATRFEVFSLRGAPVASAGQGLPLPGPASWSIRIVKARASPIGFDQERHLAVAWDHEKGCFHDAFSLALPALPRNRPAPAEAHTRFARIV